VPESEIRKPLLLPMNAEIFPIMIRKVEVSDPQVVQLDEELKGMILGFYDGKATPAPTIIIAYARVQFVEEYIGVVAHEVLHSIGVQHSHYEGQLMYPIISSSCMGVHDTLQLSHMFGVNPDDMRPCESDGDEPVCWRDYPGNY